jgi:hypothetical protein
MRSGARRGQSPGVPPVNAQLPSAFTSVMVQVCVPSLTVTVPVGNDVPETCSTDASASDTATEYAVPTADGSGASSVIVRIAVRRSTVCGSATLVPPLSEMLQPPPSDRSMVTVPLGVPLLPLTDAPIVKLAPGVDGSGVSVIDSVGVE